MLGLAFGYGISDNVADAYQFLMRTYESEDKIYVFGFSRGAYTARALCGMLCSVGLLSRGNEGLIPYAVRILKERPVNFDVVRDFKRTFSNECKPHFVGVWDTVSSVGWVYNAVRFPYTAKNPDLNIVRHAVSIDERRAFFRQNMFVPEHPDQDIVQLWFAGVHSDVGGSYAESESQLSKIAFEWMLCEAEFAGLAVYQQQKAEMLGGSPSRVAPDAATKKQHESLHGPWWIAEIWPKVVRVHQPGPGDVWKNRIRLNLARRRYIPDGSSLHASVEQRMASVSDYRPKNLRPLSELRQNYRIIGNRRALSTPASFSQS